MREWHQDMQQRVGLDIAQSQPARRKLHGWFIAFGISALASSTAAPSARALDAAGVPGDSDLPMVLLVPDRPRSSTGQQDDLIFRMKTALRDALTKSGRFQVHTFLPGENVIKRALNEHLIAADDLAEPLKAEGLQRIARAIGAKFILRFATTLDRVEARTDMKYLDNTRLTDWTVLAEERIGVPLVLPRMNGIKPKHLTPDNVVDLTVDSITSRIGIPTHLAAALQAMPGLRALEDLDRAGKKGRAPHAVTTDPGTPGTSDGGETAGPAGGDGGGAAPSTKPVSRNAKTNRAARNAAGAAATSPGSNADRGARPVQPVFTNEADPARGALPKQPSIAPAPIIARPDYETQAARYRQTGDLGNAVVALRKAVNVRPRDVNLRRELILAYQSCQMQDAAHAEAARSLQMDPSNASLYRLYGEVLLTEHDLPRAMQAFRDGIRVDPSDIACQVALGDALLADNHYLQALDAYETASKGDPKSPMPHRRIGRAMVARAATDSDQYQNSLVEIRRARELTPPTDTASYMDDYVAIMRLVDSRIREMLDELQATNQARVQAKRSQPELERQIADMKQRNAALSEYLDKLPPAVGHDVTQAHYLQANALLLQAIGFFKDLVEKGDDRFADSMKSGQVQAQRELAAAGQRLTGTKSPDRPSGP